MLPKSEKGNKLLTSTIDENDSISFYPAYQELEKKLKNLTYIDFGLYVFDGDIRIFDNEPDDNGNLKQLLGSGMLYKFGIADEISNEQTKLHETLIRFQYSKSDIEEFKHLTAEIAGGVYYDGACSASMYAEKRLTGHYHGGDGGGVAGALGSAGAMEGFALSRPASQGQSRRVRGR